MIAWVSSKIPNKLTESVDLLNSGRNLWGKTWKTNFPLFDFSLFQPYTDAISILVRKQNIFRCPGRRLFSADRLLLERLQVLPFEESVCTWADSCFSQQQPQAATTPGNWAQKTGAGQTQPSLSSIKKNIPIILNLNTHSWTPDYWTDPGAWGPCPSDFFSFECFMCFCF